MKLWGGRFAKQTAIEFEAFSSSIQIDSKMAMVDIRTSMAHARMLAQLNIISADDSQKLQTGLLQIQEELTTGRWSFDPEAEDIHGEIEKRLFELIGEPAKKIHTARSRNDQVATDTRLYLSEKVHDLLADLKAVQALLVSEAEKHTETLMPGMTHLQHAQPVSLAHHLMAYFWMFERDLARLADSQPRIL
jgi:argininosuccinate lyase